MKLIIKYYEEIVIMFKQYDNAIRYKIFDNFANFKF